MNWIREKRTLANKSEDGILSRKKAKCEDTVLEMTMNKSGTLAWLTWNFHGHG